MPKTTRSRNLDLARWLNHGHKSTSKKLSAITNENYISKMATGDMEISDRRARQIEKALDLPPGWLDRENESLLMTHAEDFSLLQLMRSLPPEAKLSLSKFISSMLS